MPSAFGISDLLVSRGFELTNKCKLVRHKDGRYDIQQLRRTGWIDHYQATQAKPVFSKCQSIVSFVGDGAGRALLLGVYQVHGKRKTKRSDFPKQSPFYDLRKDDLYWYELEQRTEFDDLIDRVVIEWSSERSWHQWFCNRPIIEIYPPGRSLLPFNDYFDFTLEYRQLCELIDNPEAHRDWKSSLSAVSGIYLILAQNSGDLYVGSAYGLDGIWGRWSQYAKNGHGGNKVLRKLVKESSSYPECFRFSVLQVLPRTTKKAEVIRWETTFKKKLGSRITGLNMN